MIALIFLLAGLLVDESEDDSWRYCYYDDGRVVTVGLTHMCPMKIPDDDAQGEAND